MSFIERRHRIRKRRARAVAGLLCAAAMASASLSGSDDASAIFRQVYEEVRTMPARSGELFIRQEFFIGEDDDDTNKDLSVSIVLPEGGQIPVMIVQFTWMERDRSNRRISRARTTKTLRCIMETDGARLEGEGFENDELRDLARGLLKAVRDKKRLLQKTPSRGSAEPRDYPSRG